MGGEATHRAAANTEGVEAFNIGAAVAYSPAYWNVKSLVPILFGTGSHDAIVDPKAVWLAYEQSKDNVSAVFGNIKGANHHECSTGENRWAPYTASFFNCHLLGNKKDCENIYGDSSSKPCSLCHCDDEIPMKQCEFTNAPNF